MGFVIWYKLQIDEPPKDGGGFLAAAANVLLGIGLPVKVSNDILSGAAHIVDSDVTLRLQTGAVASTFELKITNLPNETTDLLKSKHDDAMKKQDPLQVKVFLGYFDEKPIFGSPDVTFEGAIMKLNSEVNDSGVMETTIKGQELTGYKLRMACAPLGTLKDTLKGEQTYAAVFKALLSSVDPSFTLVDSHGLTKKVKDFTPQGRTVLEVIRRIAESLKERDDQVGVPVVIRDKKLYVYKAVGAGSAVTTLSEDNDIVSEKTAHDAQETKETIVQCPGDAAAGGGNGNGAKKKVKSPARPSTALTVLGNTKPRPGDVVSVKHSGKDPEDWRVEQVEHHFSMSSGFTTDLRLIKASAGDTAADPGGAHGVLQRFTDVAEATEKTSIDVGEVNDYNPGADGKHLATLNYGQDTAVGEVAPSVTEPINQQGAQLLNKPIASPFAFDKCGLVVPIYPKMRALLAHNQGTTNDAILNGFLWAENPRLQPPKNKPGDYWLCLPTGLSNGLPSGKGVNDLIDAKGERVIQAKGIKIFVGTDQLPDVGERPTVDDALDGTIVIEHQKGAKVTITSDGAIKVETRNQDISMTTGQVTLTLGAQGAQVSLTNGSVNLKLTGSTVAVS